MDRLIGGILAVVAAVAAGDSASAWAAGVTQRVSVGPGAAQANGNSFGPTLSADGRFVLFFSDATNLLKRGTTGKRDLFVRDRRLGTTERVSVALGGGQPNAPFINKPSISADGRFVAFDGEASNLVPGDTNRAFDVFVRDRDPGADRRHQYQVRRAMQKFSGG